VLDLVTQVRDVVFVNCIFSLGNLRGSGFRNEGYMGWSGEMGRSVYEQPGNEVDRILSQQGGFQVSKGKRRGAKGIKKGDTESKGIAHKLHCLSYIRVHSECLQLSE
jgi:hypothetical protein